MITIDPQKFDRYCDLKDKYVEKYKSLNLPDFALFPKEFYEISDYDIQSDLLEIALRNNIRVEQTEYIQQVRAANAERRLSDNINEQIRMK